MQVFWCDQCQVPVLYAADKNKEKVKNNPYFDLEDEVVTEALTQDHSKVYYHQFQKIKELINQAIDNSRKKIEVDQFYNKVAARINETDYHQVIKEFGLKYAELKLFERQGKQQKKDHTCPECGTKAYYISSDIRPVFMKERVLLSELLEEDLTEENIWNGAGNRYIVDGEPKDILLSDLYEIDGLEKKIDRIQDRVKAVNNEVDFSQFIKVNKEHFKYIDSMAVDFIEKVSDLFIDKMQIVSFSGGKDSTVISNLVTRALNTKEILHIFGDTTLEFPLTYEYVERIKERPQRPPFLPVDTPEREAGTPRYQRFMELADKFGPPSRIMSWCCTIFKTGPIGKLLREISDQQGILTFYGIRRSESVSRSGYDKITTSPKIAKQLVVSPIIDWHDADVWLYLLSRKIDFNEAYRLGFTRVGCWCCPNNSDWSEFLCKIFMPEKAEKWRDFLVDFAKRVGKPDPEVYVDNGKWKARQGGAGLNTGEAELEVDICGDPGDNVKNYNLKRPISEELYELFKPFGVVDYKIDNAGIVNVLDESGEEVKFKLKGTKGRNQLTIEVENKNLLDHNNAYQFFKRVECQLRKYQFCENCSACANICPYDAISLLNGYKINEEKCVHCKECIAHFDRGCLIAKTMKVKDY